MQAFSDGMNRKVHLPKYIIIIIDRDILDAFANFEGSLTQECERALKWFAREMDRKIEECKEQLNKIKQGALLDDIFPRIIWLEMFDRPFTIGDIAFETFGKFNRAINQVALHQKNARVMEVSSALQCL